MAWLVFAAEFDSVHKLFHSHTFKFTFFFEYFLIVEIFLKCYIYKFLVSVSV